MFAHLQKSAGAEMVFGWEGRRRRTLVAPVRWHPAGVSASQVSTSSAFRGQTAWSSGTSTLTPTAWSCPPAAARDLADSLIAGPTRLDPGRPTDAIKPKRPPGHTVRWSLGVCALSHARAGQDSAAGRQRRRVHRATACEAFPSGCPPTHVLSWCPTSALPRPEPMTARYLADRRASGLASIDGGRAYRHLMVACETRSSTCHTQALTTRAVRDAATVPSRVIDNGNQPRRTQMTETPAKKAAAKAPATPNVTPETPNPTRMSRRPRTNQTDERARARVQQREWPRLSGSVREDVGRGAQA